MTWWLQKRLYRFWYRRIFLRSPAWERTKQLRKIGYCQRTGVHTSMLHLHHINYLGLPKMRWWHWLPFGRFTLWRPDMKSRVITLCSAHHALEHSSKGRKK